MVDFNRRRAAQAIGALVAAPIVTGCGERAAPALLAFSGPTMAGRYSVKVARAGKMSDAAARALGRGLFQAVDAVDRGMSTYRPESELMRLNAHRAEAPLAVSPALAEVLGKAHAVSRASDGAFDVTIGAIVNAWGFGPRGRGRLPRPDEIAALRERVSWAALMVDPRAGTVTKTRPEAFADLSGVAQGYGADRIAAELEARGLGDYLVEVSGEVRARGVNAEGAPWRIGIERPEGGARTVQFVVPLSNRSLATSGDYRNFFEQDGRRYSHEIDPATGAPVAHRLGSVSVVHSDCATADAWATALFVLGPQRGVRLAEAQDLAAYFIVRGPDGHFAEIQTGAFAALGGRAVQV